MCIFNRRSFYRCYLILATYKMKPSDLATKVIHDVYKQTGITATCGVGTNLYLAKVAMDIAAKHVKPNKFGVRIACLDEQMYKHNYGVIDLLLISGELEKELLKNWSKIICILWGI